jgi:serine/tyrosine/threonine adenylyltransferase
VLIPRNHRVEAAIAAATNQGDFEPFETLALALTTPYDERPEHAHLALPPKLEERVVQTFCGT